jgi:hypothetical protein
VYSTKPLPVSARRRHTLAARRLSSCPRPAAPSARRQPPSVTGTGGGSHQGPHRAVQRVAVVAAELGVGALEGGEAVGLGLLDAAPCQGLLPLWM